MPQLHRSIPQHTDLDEELPSYTGQSLLLSYRATQLLAILIGVLPFYAFVIWAHLTKEDAYSLEDLFFYPLVVGTLGIIWLIFLHTTLCREKLRSLNLRPASWSRDLSAGVLLMLLAFVWRAVEGLTIRQWLPREPPAPEIPRLLLAVAENPWLLALWLGPVVWIGVALFEEFSRVFMLKRLWSLTNRSTARWGAVFFSALLFGAAHLYQGISGVISAATLGLIWGLAYLWWGRLWPLVIAHALFDSLQIVWVVIQIRGGQ